MAEMTPERIKQLRALCDYVTSLDPFLPKLTSALPEALDEIERLRAEVDALKLNLDACMAGGRYARDRVSELECRLRSHGELP